MNAIKIGTRVKVGFYSSFGMATATGTVVKAEADWIQFRPDERFSNLREFRVSINDVLEIED